jgi:outer membrane protein TolC
MCEPKKTMIISTFMKKILLSLLLLFQCLLLQVPAMAQSVRSFNPLKDEIMDVVPPLSVLLDSAFLHDPTIKSSNYDVQIGRSNLKTVRREWTQNLGLQANVGYGTFNSLYNTTGNTSANQNYFSSQSQTQYQVGGWFYLPLNTVINHRNTVTLAKLQIDKSQSELAAVHNELQKQVIKQYHDLIANQRLLKIKSTYLETCKINMQLAEKSFLNGTITIDEYSRVSEIESRTESDYETARMNFLVSYQTLEVMVGMNFNLNTTIQQNNEGK